MTAVESKAATTLWCGPAIGEFGSELLEAGVHRLVMESAEELGRNPWSR